MLCSTNVKGNRNMRNATCEKQISKVIPIEKPGAISCCAFIDHARLFERGARDRQTVTAWLAV